MASLHTPQPHFPLVQSLFLGTGAAVFACILGAFGVLPHPLSLRSGLQLAALLPLTCALAWIALSVASLRWRSILQGAALAQLAGASALRGFVAIYTMPVIKTEPPKNVRMEPVY